MFYIRLLSVLLIILLPITCFAGPSLSTQNMKKLEKLLDMESDKKGSDSNTIVEKAITVKSHDAVVSGSFIIDYSKGATHVLELSDTTNINMSFAGFTNGKLCKVVVFIKNGVDKVTWSDNVKWDIGKEANLTSGEDILTFMSYDGGATIYGFHVGMDMKPYVGDI